MNRDEWNYLCLRLDLSSLIAQRYIYALQLVDNTFQFGTARNKYGAKKVEITEDNGTYNIRFIYYKPDYKNFKPVTKRIKYEELNITEERLKELLHTAFFV